MEKTFESIIVTDEFGNEEEFLILDEIFYDGRKYAIMSNGDFASESSDAELLVMSVEDHADEDFFESLDDEDLADEIVEYWIRNLSDENSDKDEILL